MKEVVRMKNEQREREMMKLEEKLSKETCCTDEQIKFITEQTPLLLLSKLKNSELTAVEVLNAFQYKALQVTKKINCITEFIPEAQLWAEQCDMIPIEDRQPLHGLPISLKENIGVKGMDSTLGLAKHLYNPVAKHSKIVEILLKNGAIPFCKTNVPQVLLSFCCSNPVYGKTLNPHDPSRTPGGSSGGETALIASGGSIVGIGSDLAGSARVPASMSGCYGIRLTSTRVSSMGFSKGVPGMYGVFSSPGVLGRDSHITALVVQVLIETQESDQDDAAVVSVPWSQTCFSYDRKLTFGYFNDTSFFPCTPGVKRAVLEAKVALENLGHHLVPFELINPESIFLDSYKVATADKGRTLYNHLEGEPIDPSLKSGLIVSAAQGLERIFLQYFVSHRSPFLSIMFKSNLFDVLDLWNCFQKRRLEIQELEDRMKREQIDLILGPVYPLPAPQHYVPALIAPACFYTLFANYYDFASGAVPVTIENEEDQMLLENYPVTDHVFRLIKKATKGAAGMPIGVTITGLSYQDELVLKGMQELEKALKIIDL